VIASARFSQAHTDNKQRAGLLHPHKK